MTEEQTVEAMARIADLVQDAAFLESNVADLCYFFLDRPVPRSLSNALRTVIEELTQLSDEVADESNTEV